VSLLRCIDAVEREEADAKGDEKTGMRVVRLALEVPTRQLAENSGADGGVVVEKIRNLPQNSGFDAATGDYTDMFERGIIDPVKVVRVALENAASVAGVLLMTEATLTEIEDEEEKRREPAEV
jgi:chaperonin GroEL